MVKKRLKKKRLKKKRTMAIVPAGQPQNLAQVRKKLKKKVSVNPADKSYAKTVVTAKRQAEIDFVTDPDSQDCTYHHGRKDRNYKKLVELSTFHQWHHWGEWKKKRRLWWLELQERVLGKIQDKYLAIRLKEVDKLQTAEDFLFEYLLPQFDENGELERESKTGLPVYALPLGSVSNVASTILAIMERKMSLRGDAVQRGDVERKAGEVHLHKHQHLHMGDKVDKGINEISIEEAQKLSRALITMRDPELGESYQKFIDTEGETTSG